ncbi:hypothetical protein [uncultured Methanobrevibacter sp.]|nr:hypothetical protein [uncultured Methanobrevibacter sp.]
MSKIRNGTFGALVAIVYVLSRVSRLATSNAYNISATDKNKQ